MPCLLYTSVFVIIGLAAAAYGIYAFNKWMAVPLVEVPDVVGKPQIAVSYTHLDVYKRQGVTGQRVTFEYMMLKGVNDSKEDAIKLANLVNGIDCLVNIIPWNPVPGVHLQESEPGTILDFVSTLERNRVKVTVRRRLGGNIKAACGQLRRVIT